MESDKTLDVMAKLNYNMYAINLMRTMSGKKLQTSAPEGSEMIAPASSSPRGVDSQSGTTAKKALAVLMFTLGIGNAQAQQVPVTTNNPQLTNTTGKSSLGVVGVAATTGPSTMPAPGTPTLDLRQNKGDLPMVTFGGKVMSVAEVEKILGNMNPTERKKAVDAMDDTSGDTYENYLNTKKQVVTKEAIRAQIEAQAAIEVNKGKLQNEQAVIKEGERIDTRTQAVIKEGERIKGELLGKYQLYVSNIEKGAEGKKEVLERIKGDPITPEELKKRIDAIMQRKDLKIAGL